MERQKVFLQTGEYFGSSVRQIAVNGLTLTLSHYTDRERQPWHTHQNPTLFFLMQGGLRDRLRRQETDLDSMMLVYHPMDESHCSEAGPMGLIGLNIEPSSGWLSTHQLSSDALGSYAVLPCPTARLRALRMLLQAFTQSALSASDLETDAFEMLVPLISQRLSCSEPHPPRWLRRVEAFLNDSRTETIRLREAAREADVHPVHLARVFRAHYGCSVGAYVRRMRLLRATDQVLQHRCNLGTAAHEAGFADQAHFTRLFVREVGLPPNRLLRLHSTG